MIHNPDTEAQSAAAPRGARLALALLVPVAALALQWALWTWIQPFGWMLFLPAVFISAHLGGRAGGLSSTVLSGLLVWYFFLPTELSWHLDTPAHIWSVVLFAGMGILVSEAQARLDRAARTRQALVESRAAEERLSRLYDESRALDELKSRFYANLSHELRTPLTLILNPVAKQLADDGLAPTLRRDLEVVERNARLLYRHVTDLLDVAKLEAGHMALHLERADLAHLTRGMCANFEGVARERGIALEIAAPDSLAARIDAEKVQRILLNLLSNAFKFAPEGGAVRLVLQAADDEAEISVQDDGPGVPPDLRETIFEPFRQADSSATRRTGGTGLGLAIVRQFVELHGGAATVTDAPGGGALFRVRLPLAAADMDAPPPPNHGELDPHLRHQAVDELRPAAQASAPLPAEGPLVLIVEDNADMASYLADALGRHYRVALAGNGRDGLAQAAALSPDLILTDLMMPELGGDTLVHTLRARPEMADVPIVVLTAQLDERLRVDLLQAGVQDYLTKPFGEDELLARVGGLVAERRRTGERLRASEARFEATFDQAGVGIAQVAPDGRWLRVNRKLCDIVGYGEEELLAGRFQDITHPDDLQADLAAMRQLLGGELATFHAEKRYLHKDGHVVWIDLTVSLTWKPDGRPDYFIAVIEDISARKQAEDALRKFSRVIEQTASTVVITDAAGVIEYVNPRFTAATGYTAAESIGRTPAMIKSGHTSDEDYRELWHTIKSGGVWQGELLNRRKDGTLYWESAIISPIRDDAGRITHYAGVKDDITARKQAEEALRESEALLRQAQRMACIGHWRWDFRADLPFWSDEIYRIFGLSPTLPPADYKSLPRHYTPESWQRLSAAVDKAIHEGVPYTLDLEVVRADGSRRWVLARGEPGRDAGGAIVELRGMMQDITERKEAEEALRDSEERLAAIVDSAMDAVISVDEQQRIVLFNPAAGEMFGLSPPQAMGQPLARLIPQRFRQGHDEHIRRFGQTGLTTRHMGALGEVRGLRANGEEFPAEASISQTSVAGGKQFTVILRDISGRKQTEAALAALRVEMELAMRFHVAGQTVAAIAHELNQPLNAVASYSEAALRLLRAGNPQPDKLQRALEGSAQQAQRAGTVMRELVTFLKKGEVAAEPMDLNDTVQKTVLSAQADGGFRSRLELEPDLPPVRANRMQVEKVLLILIQNGVEAMRDAGIEAPSITVTVRTAADGAAAQVTVRDSGPGIDAQTLHRIFNPFFSTKRQGLGMGLPISRAIIEALDGQLWVESEPGAGASFHFTLPFAPQPQASGGDQP